jgi:hypothetical protein
MPATDVVSAPKIPITIVSKLLFRAAGRTFRDAKAAIGDE